MSRPAQPPAPSPIAKLSGFDGLRAVAAGLVLGYHVALAGGWTRAGALAPLAAELKGGVTIFFVISGFLLYLPYARALARGDGLPDRRSYTQRRAVRIIPAYWVCLTVLSLGPLAASLHSASWWRYYGLSQIYTSGTIFNGLPVAWSLCVEVSFYALLPVFARGMAGLVRLRRPVRSQLTVLAALGLASVALRLALAGSLTRPVPGRGFTLVTALPGMLDWFVIGVALAILASEWERGAAGAAWLARLADRPAWCWAGAALLYLAGAALQHGDMFLPLYGVLTHVALGAASGLVVLPLTRPRPRGRGVGLLSARATVWLGTISYGIYLWHVPLLEAIRGPLANVPARPDGILVVLGLFVAVVAGAIALGAVSWYMVERPAQRLARRSAVATGRVATADA